MTGADIIAAKLAQAGCRHAFGIPGGEVLALMGALDEAGIAFHLTKHENAAGFMAEGVWHAEPAPENGKRGRTPGILLATIGPGVANAVNVVANALQDRVPLIFLTGCVDAPLAETYTHQVFDHQAMLRPIVKATFRASPGTLGVMMEKALAIAFEGQPGPVHIDVPIGVAEGETQEVLRDLQPLPNPTMQQPGPKMAQALEALNSAERPLVIAGVDAVTDNASQALTRFCEDHGIPVLTTYKAKGLVDERLPMALSGHGLSPRSDKIVLPLIAQSDCVVLAGYDPIEMRVGWRNIFADDAHVIDITPTLRDHGMHHTTMTLRGRVDATLDQLGAAMDKRDRWPRAEPATARAALKDLFKAPTHWGPGLVFATLNACLPHDVVITADSGAHRILVTQMWESTLPHRFLQSTALCTMACAVPLAAGYKIASPQTPVCAFVGDAGLEMGLGELATLRDMGQPVIICVLVDESLALIELKQRGSQRPNVGVDFSGSDFPAIAQAMGGHGEWVDDAQTLERTATEALSRTTFTVLACRIGRRAYDGTF
ncbi:MAG: thiamine pyrophosphate-binding protein [Pseudomonadota bacterium]